MIQSKDIGFVKLLENVGDRYGLLFTCLKKIDNLDKFKNYTYVNKSKFNKILLTFEPLLSEIKI